jgi:methionyl-tRNA synthetase
MALPTRPTSTSTSTSPGLLAKDPAQAAEVQSVCTQGINLFRVLALYLGPVMPQLAAGAERFLGLPPQCWADAAQPLLGRTINGYEPLATRVDPSAVRALLAASAESLKPAGVPQPAGAVAAAAAAPAAEPATPTISIEEFGKVDLRVARIERAARVDGADRLLELGVDLGELGKRTIFAGIRSAYQPEQLVGRLTVVVANLEPRKMRFGTSEGMVLAAGPGGQDIFLLSPDAGAAPGMKVK